ncbi:hypothetical protein TraAM80_09430, partial [Trypanosoma rangeli]
EAADAMETMQCDAAREREEAVATLAQEVQRLKVELEGARREQEEAAGAMETMQCDAAREREEAVATLAQEVQRLKVELEGARRRRVVGGTDMVCGACVAKDARMDEWKGRVKLIIERNEEQKRLLTMQLDTSRAEAERARLEFTEAVESLRGSMVLLQSEVSRLVEERLVMAETLRQWEDFKAMIVKKIVVK